MVSGLPSGIWLLLSSLQPSSDPSLLLPTLHSHSNHTRWQGVLGAPYIFTSGLFLILPAPCKTYLISILALCLSMSMLWFTHFLCLLICSFTSASPTPRVQRVLNSNVFRRGAYDINMYNDRCETIGEVVENWTVNAQRPSNSTLKQPNNSSACNHYAGQTHDLQEGVGHESPVSWWCFTYNLDLELSLAHRSSVLRLHFHLLPSPCICTPVQGYFHNLCCLLPFGPCRDVNSM